MNISSQALYDLLPTIYRLRDGEGNQELKSYLSVFAEQIAVLQENIDQLYDDQFIETCAEWMVPYIGDLIAYKPLHIIPNTNFTQRAEVANTLAYRRRKGTATMLEQMARDVTGWPAKVVEFFQILSTTQYMNHTRLYNYASPSLLNWEALQNVNKAFDSTSHTVDVRHIDSDKGKYNIKNIGIYLWRLQAYSITQTPLQAIAPGRYFLNPLQHNTQLFCEPKAEENISQLAERINVPHPINRRVMDAYKTDYYGTDKSVAIFVFDDSEDELVVFPEKDIRICCLSDNDGNWINEPVDTFDPDNPGALQRVMVIDPESGRMAIPPHMQVDPQDYWATYHYGFSANMGGGEYERASAFDDELDVIETVSNSQSIQTAINNLSGSGIVEITDSEHYTETLGVEVNANTRMEIRAANETRPLITLNSDLEISGVLPIGDEEGGVVTLDGLVIAGGKIIIPELNNGIRLVRLRHCTLVPGLNLDIHGDPTDADEASIEVHSNDVRVEIDHCILGGLRVVEGAEVSVNNSIIDANANDAVAYSAIDNLSAGGILTIKNSTVIGKVHTRIMQFASNTIFDSKLSELSTWLSPVMAERKQQGCVRFSYVPLNSRLPRRYRCQPELAINQAIEKEGQSITSAQKALISERIENRIRVAFTDTRYGQAAYMQLSSSCADEITHGADDESEMGAFHDLFQPQREINLKIRLKEYLRFGLEAGIFYET